MSAHTIAFRVYYEDTDVAGVVYYANYLKYAERARTEWLRSLGFEQSLLMKEEQVIFPVSKVQVTYHKPAVLDDLLCIETNLLELRRVKMSLSQKIYKGKELLTSIEIVIACVNLDNKPVAFPKSLFDKLTF